MIIIKILSTTIMLKIFVPAYKSNSDEEVFNFFKLFHQQVASRI